MVPWDQLWDDVGSLLKTFWGHVMDTQRTFRDILWTLRGYCVYLGG